MCLLYDGSTRRLTESGFMWFYGFMEKPGIEPATPGLQGIALIHYTTGAKILLAEFTTAATLKAFNRQMVYYIIITMIFQIYMS